MNETQNTYEIDLRRLLRVVLKRWWLVALSALICALGFGFYTSEFVTPKYTSTAIMHISTSTSSPVNLNELETARNLVDSYEYLIKGIPQTLSEVVDKADLSYTPSQLSSMVSVSSGGGGTEFLEITVTGEDAEEVCLIANTIMEVVPGRAAAANMDSTISAAGWASVAKVPSSPNVTKNIAVGFVLGFVFSVAIIVMCELLDDRIKSEDWLKESFKDEIPLLAVIPSSRRADTREGYRKYYAYHSDSSSKED